MISGKLQIRWFYCDNAVVLIGDKAELLIDQSENVN